MPIKVTYQNPALEYDENMVCEDFSEYGNVASRMFLKKFGKSLKIIGGAGPVDS